jgi:pectate lyase
MSVLSCSLLLWVGCSGGAAKQLGGSGGSTAASSAVASGGVESAGGTAAATAVGSGGWLASGGLLAVGGSPGKDGVGGSATAGVTSAGGVSAAGGSSVLGGKTGSGGGVTTGGSPMGGALATGGAPAVGGTSGSTCVGPAETKPLGYGQSTTGGGSAKAVEANTLAAVQAAIDGYSGAGGLVIKYTGKFDFATIADPCTQWKLAAQIVEIKKKSDITILGADGSSANFGFHIAASSSNIIIRNMTIGLLPGGDAADAISLEGMSGGFPSNVWIDHNELFSALVECAGAGDSSFDGLIDMKKGADNVTVSYNLIHDHDKVSLNGYSDDDTAVRHVTFHHNIFQNVRSRTPLQRNGYSHMLNNLITGVTTSGMNIRMGGYSLIEGNYFESAQNPVTSRDSSALGFWDLRSNNILGPSDFATYEITWVASTSTPTKDATDWTTTAKYPVDLGYAYTPDPPACLKADLASVAGAGKGLATLKCSCN